MSIILGIDPGSRLTGYGVIDCESNVLRYITSGVLKIVSRDIAEQLREIFVGVSEIITANQPVEAAIEQVFVHINVNSALKLGQARGAAIVALAQHGLPVAEYSARQVKQAVVGYGAGAKEQVQQMVKALLKLPHAPVTDAADALAIAICHAHTRRSRQLIERSLRKKI